MSLSNGSLIGSYQVQESIGAGGMGEVYRARDTKLKRDVAVKVLPEVFARDAARMARFQREAEVLASLNHPNIASIYGVEDCALVMELVLGDAPKGPLPFEEAWKIASQIAAALEYAHDKGVIHRDLKPANIKVTPDGVVKLLDFGLAKAFSAPGAAGGTASGSASLSPTLTVGATEVGMILGTAAYMSPEQARGKNVDRRADIWSFGVVLYELLTGLRLFEGEDVTETLASVVKDQPDLTKVPPKARRLLERCLEKDPKKRLRDIGDAVLLIDNAPAAPTAAPTGLSRFGKLGWTAAGVFLLTTLATGFVHFREKPSVAPVFRFDVTPPANGAVTHMTLSPDGTKLAMEVQGNDGKRAIWVRSLDTVEARKIPGTDESGSPAWSPDGRYIGFVNRGRLMKVDVSGGAPETICTYSSPYFGMSWGPNDVIVFAGGYVMNRVSAAGGDVTQLTQLDIKRGDVGAGHPWFLPDGKHFVYMLVANDRNTGLFVGSIDAKPADQERKRLTESESNGIYTPGTGGGSGTLLFLRRDTLTGRPFDASKLQFAGDPIRVADSVGNDGTYRGLFTASQTGVLAVSTGGSAMRQLTWFDRQGKILSHSGESSERDEMALSPDGAQLAEGRVENGVWVVWLLDLMRGSSARFTFDPNGAGNATWSADGRFMFYAAGGGRSSDIFRKPSNGATKEEVLYHSDALKTPLDSSPDGNWLLYTEAGKDTRLDLWALPDPGGPIDSQRKPVPYLVTPFNEGQAAFSPDGKWIAYTSNESGTNEIYVRPFPASSGGKWLVSGGGGGQARWRPDGKELFYAAPDGTLMVAETHFSPTFQAGTPKVLFKPQILGGLGGGPQIAWRYAISRDGQRFLINTATEEKNSAPVTVTTEWMNALKK